VTRVVGSDGFLPQPAGPYSQAVRIGSIAYTAGQVGIDPVSGAIAGSDCAGQARQALANLRAALAALSATPADVLRCGVYLTSVEDFDVMNAEYREFFAEPYPARTTVYVGLPPGLLVEIDAIVALP
jgi:2-iminobutanoate/2-iminopropanoate deaminase